IRVLRPPVGGCSGQKVPTFPEEVIVAYLARKLARPIKWIEERTEHFLAGGHAREERLTFEAAYEPDGRVTALDVRIVADVGVPATFCGWAMSYVTAYCVPAACKIPDCRVEVFTVVTNKFPCDGYRDFGTEAGTFP